MMTFVNDLHRLRPSNFYAPDGFFPKGSHDDFWLCNEDLLHARTRFRLSHFHCLMTAMELDDKYFTCDQAIGSLLILA